MSGLWAISALIAALACAILVILIAPNSGWRTKLTIIVVTFVGLAVSYNFIHQLLGFPVALVEPPSGRLLSSLVREPEPKTGAPGSIVLWVVPDTPDGLRGDGLPRAISLPYERALHEELFAKQRQAGERSGLRVRTAPTQQGTSRIAIELDRRAGLPMKATQ